MQIKVLHSKIHRARVTGTHLEYEGSVTVDQDLLDAAGMVEGQAVLIANLNNGSRQETYIMPGDRGSGVIRLNGASARLAAVGDLVIIMTFAYLTPEEVPGHTARKIIVNAQNHIIAGV
jgi:aspartate 1-decarboxylase